jgi:hypothetical protein
MPPQVSTQLPRPAHGGNGLERVDGKMQDRDPLAGEFGIAKAVGPKTSDVYCKARGIERFRDLRQLTFTSALAQMLRQQQHRDRPF